MSLLEELIIKSAHSIQKQDISNQSIQSIQSSNQYLNHLSSLSLDQLKQQPSQLQSISNSLESELSLLCFRQFKNLLITHQTSISIKKAFNRLIEHVNQFIQTTDQLDQLSKNLILHPSPSIQTTTLTSHLNSIINDRNQIKLILTHLPSFESLLELPQLISTCINNQQNLLWNQAIDLALKIRHLNHNLNPSPSSPSSPHPIGFIQLIQIQVDRTLQSLRDHLLNRLADANLKLPLAVRTISTLRRLSSILFLQDDDPTTNLDNRLPISSVPINEIELRMSFLVSRWIPLVENLNQLRLSSGLSLPSINPVALNVLQPEDVFNDQSSQLNDDHLKFLRRWLELWREFVGDTLSIYTDIFLNTPSSSRIDIKHHQHSSKYSSKQFLNDPQTPLNYFLSQALNLLTSVLAIHLNSITSVSSLASLLTQLAYCGVAFGKSGFDFTATLFPLILDRLEHLIKVRFQLGLQQLQINLRPIISPSSTFHSFNRPAGFQIRRRSVNPLTTNASTFIALENCLISPDSINQVLKLKPEQLKGPECETSMRHCLSFFPLLARFVNSQYTALNELRLLPSARSYAPVSDAQFESLKAVTEQLVKVASVLCECTPANANGNSMFAELNLEDEMTEDHEKRSETRLRLVIHQLVLVWTRSVLPNLEHSLRDGIYQELEIKSPEPRFLDLLNQCESLLSSIIPPRVKVVQIDQNPVVLDAQFVSDQDKEPIDERKAEVSQEAEKVTVEDQKRLEETGHGDVANSSQVVMSEDLPNSAVSEKAQVESEPQEDTSNTSSSAPPTSIQLESKDEGLNPPIAYIASHTELNQVKSD